MPQEDDRAKSIVSRFCQRHNLGKIKEAFIYEQIKRKIDQEITRRKQLLRPSSSRNTDLSDMTFAEKIIARKNERKMAESFSPPLSPMV